jgi:hypothetical protein
MCAAYVLDSAEECGRLERQAVLVASSDSEWDVVRIDFNPPYDADPPNIAIQRKVAATMMQMFKQSTDSTAEEGLRTSVKPRRATAPSAAYRNASFSSARIDRGNPP